MVKKIKFTISKEGEVALSVEGAQGSECEAMTRPFEEGLGTLSKRTYKDSYYEATTQEGQEVGSSEGSSR